MDDDGGLGIRNWGYYEQPIKNNHLGLQLMPGMMAERNTKPTLSNGAFLHRGIGEPSMSMGFVRDSWLHHKDKIVQMLPSNNHHGYTMFSDSSEPHSLQMLQTTEQMKDNKILQIDEPNGIKKATSKKKQGRSCRVLKATKPKKVRQPGETAGNGSGQRLRSVRKNTEVVINGIDLDISRIPTPVCTCTGTPQPCYRWGVGGWQSACCTTTISMHPLPMNTKRRGCRIAGRKMSQGAFKKVLEKLAGEGYNLSNSIDLRSHWAKHGTNKFVTIR